MRILFEITHPAHLHLFRNAIRALEARGHTVALTARDKDVTVDLLDHYGFDYTLLSRRAAGVAGLARELVVRDWRLWRFCRRFRPDVLVAWIGTCAAHVGALLRRPVVVFEDAEHATLQQRITFPFVTRICTARHYRKDWGRKHVRYPSFEQLAYLHPDHFVPDPGVLERAGLGRTEPFLVVRLVSWEASHDRGQRGIGPAERGRLLERLGRYGRVVLTSEAPLPEDLEPLRLPVPAHEFHDLLAFSRLYLGEGGTVAAEAAVLGVPGIFVNTIRLGLLDRLEKHYQLAFSVSDAAAGLQIAERLLGDPATPRLWQERRRKLLAAEENLVPWIVREVESLGPAARAREPAR